MPLTKLDLVGAENNLIEAVEGDGHPVFGTMTETQAALKGVQVLSRLYARLDNDQMYLREMLEIAEDGKYLSEDDWVDIRNTASRIKTMQELLGDD